MPKQEGEDSLSSYRMFETDEFLKKLDKLTVQNSRFIFNIENHVLWAWSEFMGFAI